MLDNPRSVNRFGHLGFRVRTQGSWKGKFWCGFEVKFEKISLPSLFWNIFSIWFLFLFFFKACGSSLDVDIIYENMQNIYIYILVNRIQKTYFDKNRMLRPIKYFIRLVVSNLYFYLEIKCLTHRLGVSLRLEREVIGLLTRLTPSFWV